MDTVVRKSAPFTSPLGANMTTGVFTSSMDIGQDYHNGLVSSPFVIKASRDVRCELCCRLQYNTGS